MEVVRSTFKALYIGGGGTWQSNRPNRQASKNRTTCRIKMQPIATHLERRHRIRRYCKPARRI
jgi:hypothetical protein